MVFGTNNINKTDGDGKPRFPFSALNKNRQMGAAVPSSTPKQILDNPSTITNPQKIASNGVTARTSKGNAGKENTDHENAGAFDGFEQPKYHTKKQQSKQTKHEIQEAQNHMENPVTSATSTDWGRDRQMKQKHAPTMGIKAAKDAYNEAVRLEEERKRKLQENHFTIGQKGVQAHGNARTETKKHGVPFDDQQPGLVVLRHDLKPWTEGCGYAKGSKGTFQDPSGKWWFYKPRFWIIKNREVRVVTEVPILSNNGTGLKHTPVETWPEYLNIKPKGASSSYVPQRAGASVLELATMYSQSDRETMVVHVGAPETRDVDCDELEKIGRLDKKSLDILIADGRKRNGKRFVKGDKK